MPLTRSPQRSNNNQTGNVNLDVIHIQEDSPSEAINSDAEISSIPQANPLPHNDLYQVTLNLTKNMEAMQRQICSIQSMVLSNNVEIQKSISSLSNEIKNISTQSDGTPQSTVPLTSNGELFHPPPNPNSLIFNRNVASKEMPSCSFPNVQQSFVSNNNQVEEGIFPHPEPSIAQNHQKKIYALPTFSGLPEEWQTFYESFMSSTLEFQYSNLHNIMRLRDSLEGDARDTVEPLLSNSKNVTSIINILAETYGRPEQLIKSQIHKIRSLKPVEEWDLNSLIVFANKVINMTTFLDSVGGNHHTANPLLLSELVAKLPISRRLQWADKCLNLGQMATIVDFSNWLGELRKVVNMVTDSLPPSYGKAKYACVSVEVKMCKFCKKLCKSLAFCEQFLKLSIESRWERVKDLKVCFSCLKEGHQAAKCFSKKQCGQNSCPSIHHKLLHVERPCVNQPAVNNYQNSSLNHNTTIQARNCLADTSAKRILFQVIPIRLYGPRNNVIIYAFIDDGANVTMIDENVVNSLGITGQSDILELQWINNQVTREHTKVIGVTLSGIEDNAEIYNINNVFVTSNLDLPQQSFNSSMFSHELSDPSWSGIFLHNYQNVKPKMIISLAHAFLTVGVESPKMVAPTGPIVTKTRLGYVIYGPIKQTREKFVSCHVCKTQNEQKTLDEVETLLKDYFGLETLGVREPAKPLLSRNDQRALNILSSTTKRLGERFESGLLWRESFLAFPDSYQMALKRLNTVEKKMSKDPDFAKEYRAKINEYVEKGYARIMSGEEANVRSNKTFYLPHFGVMNPNKKKLRIVFDAAAEIEKTSLNKALLSGPDINQPLLGVLLKFRQSNVAVCGDLKEMFHQVIVRTKDQDAQRFLWRDGNPLKPIKTYVFQRMTFGATCSPTMAQYVKNLNAQEFIERYPRAVKGIIERHYVDDYVDCFETEEEAIDVVQSIKEIHKAGGFEMHNMLTNSAAVAKALGITNSNGTVDVGKKVERILGMHWVPESDTFIFVLKFHKVPVEVLEMRRIPTKRELLCIAMSVFDPFGFVADFMIFIKILMQDVWKCGTGWDGKLPKEINAKFKDWIENLPMLKDFKISRFYFENCINKDIQLHIFCDASEQAMAAVAYWRFTTPNGILVSFILGKTSCAPLRFHSIPKLELHAAVMAVRLKIAVLKYHEVSVSKVKFWTDSRTVLRWIRSDHRKYKQYVANRVSEILEGSEETQWRWCSTFDNPADKGTRFSYPIKYKTDGIWKNGPKFLLEGEENWPVECNTLREDDQSNDELKARYYVMFFTSSAEMINSIINRSSNYLKIRRTLSWILRFLNNARSKNCRRNGELSIEEELQAEKIICRQIQKENFQEEYVCMEQSELIPKSSELLTLSPYLDDEGIVRVGGRLDNATFLPLYTRRPILLPKSHRLSRIIVEYYHKINCHQNSSKVICDVRERFWIPSIRILLRSIEAKCYFCKLRKAKPEQPRMGILPKDRVTPFVRAFSYTGVDLFGPFHILIRRAKEKRWVALFTCLTVRAVHLEVVNDLSSDSFVLCLRNFINRRGVPIQIRSDNGRNFVGLRKELKNETNFLDHDKITRSLTPLGIKWIFNTPFDPSSGGAWERLVQSVKKTLFVLMKDVAPKLYTFESLLIEAESIINSRPLTHIPVTPQEPEPLTPNHFLLGTTNSTQTPSEFNNGNLNTRKQWRILQNLKNGFWGRWIKEYLPDLTRRVKWCLPSRQLQVGDIILLCDMGLPRSKWKRGRIIKTYTGSDGVIRSADIKTVEGVFKRPASKLALLDLET